MNLHPLDRFPTIKAKLGSVIVAAVGMTVLFVYVAIGIVAGFGFILDVWWQLLLGGALASAAALALARLLAIGMTKPLRDMADAARSMAQGNYGRRVHATTRDEVGQLADAFNRMGAELANVERLRRDLVANVSHELKTPISALRARLENLLDGVERPDPEVLQVMLQQAERLSRLVDQLLDLSRLESGDVLLERESLDLESLIRTVVAEVEVSRADHLVDIDHEVDPSAGRVWADRERVHQVLFNLLDNAVRFTPPGGRVVVSAARHAARCEIRVTDTGPGIPPEHLPFLFERFYRVDPARSRGAGGTGIGLAIARSVVEAHGGTIRAESEVGRGSSFAFDLPLATSQAPTTVRTGGAV